MARIIAVANKKGGVAKTTTSINLGVALVQEGKSVLLVDGDPQGHLTIGLGFSKKQKLTLKTMMEYIIAEVDYNPEEVVLHHQEGLDIIPSNKLLSGIEATLMQVGTEVLKDYLANYQRYDYIIIDCMPSLGMLTINALCACDSVIIPVQPQYYAVDGAAELINLINNIRNRYNPKIVIEGILYVMDTSRYINARRNKAAIEAKYGSSVHIFEIAIPRTESLATIASQGTSIFTLDPRSKGAISYKNLAEEIIKK